MSLNPEQMELIGLNAGEQSCMSGQVLEDAGKKPGALPSAIACPSPELLQQFFERQAETRPDHVAVVCGSTRFTYAQLERSANRLANWLRSQGVGRGDCVGLLLPRSAEVFVALLGVLKTGAAYVPLDPEYPAERVGFILADCRARALVTTSALAEKAGAFTGLVLPMDKREGELAVQPWVRPDLRETGISSEDLCYIIYTSGTTGQPKGVQIEHRSVCHLVQAEAEIFRVQPEDRVYQGFSIAFDASVEEVWLALNAGATLVGGTQEVVHAGAALSGWLEQAGVTVLSCVPTLLAMMEADVPSLRLLILGGEACPPDLVRRWWKPGRRVVNTYGPTEATVIATFAECHPDKPVTIGRAVPDYELCFLDEQLRSVSAGEAGELCIGGIGLARGYVGRPELTQEKFVMLALNGGPPRRFYRTGDLVRCRPDGEIEFLGRIDTQVKIRGFRVELSEIEAVLMEAPEVKAAAVALREDTPGGKRLVGYVVARSAAPLDEQKLRVRLRERLPAYMVPAAIETLAELPSLPSGKVDRRRLPAPRARSSEERSDLVAPRTPLERQVTLVWQKLFAPMPVSVTDDFFRELGGHSLLAAQMVSELRKTPEMAGLSMLDAYRYPTIETLAAAFEKRQPGSKNADATASREPFHPIPFWRHFFCGAAQLISLLFILTFFALQWLTPYLTYTILVEQEYSIYEALVGALLSLIFFYPVMLTIPILVKWLLIGRYKPGTYPLWGSYYFRWWLATTIEGAVPVGYLAGTPLLNIYLRLMGAKIGRNVHIDTDSFASYDLLSIGGDSSINSDANLSGYTVENGLLKIGSIHIGRRCFIGSRAALRENTVMEDDAALEDLSLLPRGGIIPQGETWQGSPARKIASPTIPAPSHAPPSLRRRFAFGLLHAVGTLIFPVLVVSAIFPGIMVMNWLNYIDPYYWYLFLAPLVGLSFVVLLGLEIAAIKWLLIGRTKPGQYPLHSFFYLRRWFVGQTMDLSLEVLGPLYASVYLAPWYKLLGARLGKGAEVSTASYVSPDLLTVGEESFIADNVSLGAPRVRDGYFTLGENRIGKRSFIGNSAMLPPGAAVGDKVLIGCLSVPPANPADAVREDTTWLGSPAIFLPERQKSAEFPEEKTFKPTAKLRILRAAIEFVRVVTPSTCFIILISLMFSAILLLHDSLDLWEVLLIFPFLYLGCALAAALIAIVAKWVLVGRYRPGEKPLWCTFVWRNELLSALHEHLAEPFLIEPLGGTPFICWYFRLLGARIGRRVYLETSDFTEFDLAHIGDEAEINADCTIQTHLFEDRVMKMSTVRIGPRCKVGAGSLVLYDTQMEAGAALDDLSLLMKGETLPAGTSWQGIPARGTKS